VREQNKLASQKCRLKRAQQFKETEGLIERLENKKEELQKLELENLKQIEKIKRFFKRRLDEQEGSGCDMCEKVLDA